MNVEGKLGLKAQGSWVYAGPNADGEKEYQWIDTNGRRYTYTDQDLIDAGIVANVLNVDHEAREKAKNRDWIKPKDRLAAGAIDRKPLPSEANAAKPKSRKPPVDKYGWPVKVESEKKSKKDKAKEVVQKIPEPGTGFLLPSVVVGGYSPHAQTPESWDVAIYKTAHLGGNFQQFKLPPVEPLKDHLKRLQKELLRLDPEEELQESEQCQVGQFGPAKKLMADQAAGGVHYHISCRCTCDIPGFQALMSYLMIGPDGVQGPAYDTRGPEVLAFTWAGPMQGPAQIADINLILPPHIMIEDGSPSAGARAMILRHDGSNPQLIPKRDGGSSAYADIPPDSIPHPKFTFMSPADPHIGYQQMVLDLDFFVIGGGAWKLNIVRQV